MSENNQQLSEEQLKEMRNAQENFYSENIPLLEKQVQFEELRARLEVARFQQLENRLKRIQIELSLKEENEEELENKEGSDNDIDK